jgi:DNA-binding transcriptional LysR family regulator
MAELDQFAAMATFVQVVESGSLSGAARAIPSSLTSVSRQVAALEAQYGTQLLLRTTRRLSLTDDGRLFYDRAKSVLGELRDIELSLSSRHSKPTGRLRVGAPTLMGRLLIAPLLAEFLRRHAAVSVDLMLVDRAVDMVEEDIHVALRVGRLRDSQLVARKLADLTMIVCASPDYLRRRGIPETPYDLSKHDCLVFSDTPGAGEWRFKASGKAPRKIQVSGRLWINSLDALVAAAKEGAGIVRVPSWQVAPEIAAGRLQRILTAEELPATPVHLVLPPSRAWPRQRRGYSWTISLSDGPAAVRSRTISILHERLEGPNSNSFLNKTWVHWHTNPLGASVKRL